MYEPERAGMGDFCHGLYWWFEAPLETIPVLSIPILEFLGVVINLVVFGLTLKRLLAGNPRVVVVLRTDALTLPAGIYGTLALAPRRRQHVLRNSTARAAPTGSPPAVPNGDACPPARAHNSCPRGGVRADAWTAGSTAFVARSHWPDEPCLEHDGAGWTVVVRAVTRHTAIVDFPHARAPSGAPFAPTRVPLCMLRAHA